MPDITTFGETMLRLSPGDGERLETADSLQFRTAGAESNAAIAASRLGADTTWISSLPNSPLGRRVVNDVRQHGVTPEVSWSEDQRQGIYFIEKGSDPRGTQVIYDRKDAAITTSTPQDVPLETIQSSKVFFTTGITPALSETLYRTTSELLDIDTTTAFDLNYRRKLWSKSTARSAYEKLLPKVDILFVPERDAQSILAVEGTAQSIADELRMRFDCETVVVTRGEDGAWASTANESIEQSAYDTETVDPIGTGDAFVGGFLSRYVRNEPVAHALEWAAATAALKRTIDGDLAIVTEDEVESIIAKEGMSIDR